MTDIRISSARIQATAILKAWNSNNVVLLHRNLAVAAEEAQSPVPDTGEGERLEMLSAIAGDMKLMLEADQLHSAVKYLPLLQHLAAPAPRSWEFAYSC
ncbi:MAG TPA: hypothetical protein VHW09_28270 [Bryobacteraceae bacterium]|nr:hypothetical protein [Bryobacteraceae bacterium]